LDHREYPHIGAEERAEKMNHPVTQVKENPPPIEIGRSLTGRNALDTVTTFFDGIEVRRSGAGIGYPFC
jgi:hypothetical protein